MKRKRVRWHHEEWLVPQPNVSLNYYVLHYVSSHRKWRGLSPMMSISYRHRDDDDQDLFVCWAVYRIVKTIRPLWYLIFIMIKIFLRVHFDILYCHGNEIIRDYLMRSKCEMISFYPRCLYVPLFVRSRAELHAASMAAAAWAPGTTPLSIISMHTRLRL